MTINPHAGKAHSSRDGITRMMRAGATRRTRAEMREARNGKAHSSRSEITRMMRAGVTRRIRAEVFRVRNGKDRKASVRQAREADNWSGRAMRVEPLIRASVEAMRAMHVRQAPRAHVKPGRKASARRLRRIVQSRIGRQGKTRPKRD